MLDGTLRTRVYHFLEPGESTPWIHSAVSAGLIALIVVNVATITLETVDELAQSAGWLFRLVEAVATAVFAVEYLVRLWVAPEREAGGARSPWQARLHYARLFAGLVDLAAVLPVAASRVAADRPDALRLFRLLRLLKITRYPALGAAISKTVEERLIGLDLGRAGGAPGRAS